MADFSFLHSERYETGHASNYAYRLYRKPEWRRLFGHFSQPYEEDYKPVPFSVKFVHHTEAWYVQKHPDDDFVETFALWLTPESEWRKCYAETPAMAKLLYVEKLVRKYGKQLPIVADGKLDMPIQEMAMSLDTWYKTSNNGTPTRVVLPFIISNDLQRLFPDRHGELVADVLLGYRKQLIQDVNQWTGINRRLVAALVDELLGHIRSQELKISQKQIAAQLMRMPVFITTLAMNYVCTGQFNDAG